MMTADTWHAAPIRKRSGSEETGSDGTSGSGVANASPAAAQLTPNSFVGAVAVRRPTLT